MTLIHDALVAADKFVSSIPVITVIEDLAWRDTIALGYCHLSLEHHAGMMALAHGNHRTPLFALFRPQMEAHLRALWARRIAPDDRLRAFLDGDETINPSARQIILQHPIEDEREALLAQHDGSWSSLCDYTHGGARQIHARLAPGDMETKFPDAHVAACVNASASLAFLSLLEMAELLKDERLFYFIQDSYFDAYPDKKPN